MKFILILTIIILFNYSLGFADYVSPQISKQEKNAIEQPAVSELLISNYVLLSQPYESFHVYKNYCNNLVRHGAQAPSEKYLNLMNNAIPKALKDLNSCHLKKTGKPITKEVISEYKMSNPDAVRETLELFNVLGAPRTTPKSRKELDNCSLDEITSILYFEAFYHSVGYQNKNWCEILK